MADGALPPLLRRREGRGAGKPPEGPSTVSETVGHSISRPEGFDSGPPRSRRRRDRCRGPQGAVADHAPPHCGESGDRALRAAGRISDGPPARAGTVTAPRPSRERADTPPVKAPGPRLPRPRRRSPAAGPECGGRSRPAVRCRWAVPARPARHRGSGDTQRAPAPGAAQRPIHRPPPAAPISPGGGLPSPLPAGPAPSGSCPPAPVAVRTPPRRRPSAAPGTRREGGARVEGAESPQRPPRRMFPGAQGPGRPSRFLCAAPSGPFPFLLLRCGPLAGRRGGAGLCPPLPCRTAHRSVRGAPRGPGDGRGIREPPPRVRALFPRAAVPVSPRGTPGGSRPSAPPGSGRSPRPPGGRAPG